MTRVKPSDVRPGQIVGEDVKDSKGDLVVRAGTSLTPEHLQTLTGLGIADVSIQDPPPAAGNDALGRMFEGTLDNPLMVALLDAVRRLRAGKAG